MMPSSRARSASSAGVAKRMLPHAMAWSGTMFVAAPPCSGPMFTIRPAAGFAIASAASTLSESCRTALTPVA